MTSTYLPKTHHAISNVVQCSMVFLIISFAHRITKDSHWKLDILIRYAFKKNMFWRVYLHTGMHSVQISCTARSQIIINIFCCVEILKHVIWFTFWRQNLISFQNMPFAFPLYIYYVTRLMQNYLKHI